MIVTTNFITGKNIETLGVVRGSIVQSKHIGKDIVAGFKNLAGGEIKSYTLMINEARDIATQRMIDEATQNGADGIVGVKYSSSTVASNVAEVIAYGTAVKFIND